MYSFESMNKNFNIYFQGNSCEQGAHNSSTASSSGGLSNGMDNTCTSSQDKSQEPTEGKRKYREGKKKIIKTILSLRRSVKETVNLKNMMLIIF